MSRKGTQPKIIAPAWPESQYMGTNSTMKVVSIDGNPVDENDQIHLKKALKSKQTENIFPPVSKRKTNLTSFHEPRLQSVESLENFIYNQKDQDHLMSINQFSREEESDESEEQKERVDSEEEQEDDATFPTQSFISQINLLPGKQQKNVIQTSIENKSPDTLFREKQRKENSLEAFLGINNALGYINKLKFDVRLSDLYTVIDSCSYNSDNFWCPVILKVGEMMQKNSQKDFRSQQFQMTNKLKQFLLQVWDKKGRMVYERQLLQPVRNWGIFGDVFIFVEEGQPKKVQIVKLRKEEPATLFTFNLNIKEIDVKLVKSSADRLDYEFASSIDHQYVAYSHGYLLYGTRKVIHFMEIASIIQQHDKSYEQEIILDFDEHQGSENYIANFQIEAEYMFKGFIDVGDNFAAMLMENETDNDLAFIRIKNISEAGIELSTCGIHDATKNQVKSPIQDVRSVITRSKDGKFTHAAVALRENYRLDFYSDFRLVDQSLPKDKFIDIEADFKQFYIKKVRNEEEIAADRKAGKKETSDHAIYKCALQWKNRIGMTSKQLFEPKEGDNRWQLIVHYRVRNNLKLYSCFLCYSTYFLVSHRNMVSVFDLKTNSWQQNMEFDDFVQCLALCQSSPQKLEVHDTSTIEVKSTAINQAQGLYQDQKLDNIDNSRATDDFMPNTSMSNVRTNVAVVVGNSQINLIKENKSGKRQMLHKSVKRISIGGRALSWLDDQECNTGLYFIVDDLPNDQLIVDVKGMDAFYTYESEMNHDVGQCKIIAYTRGRMATLLECDDDLNQKSQMSIYPGVTRESLTAIEQANDRVETATKLMISTFWVDKNHDGVNDLQASTCKVYTVIDTENDALKLKRDEDDAIEVDNFVNAPDAQKLVGAAVVKDPSYGEQQCFTVQVTDVGINIFDRHHTLYASYNNCNIKHIIFSDDAYMYCLADAVKNPISKIDNQENENTAFKDCKETSGLFCYDLYRLMNEGRLDQYKLASALVGINSNLSFSEFNQRMSFCKDFTTMQILPFAHRNTINFLGMGIRQDYLIWREKNGFFTCLSTEGILRTWSIATGKLLYRVKQKYKPDEMSNYVIYQAAKLRNEIEDNSQLMNFCNYSDRSLSIIRKKKYETKLLGSQINVSQIDTILMNLNRHRSRSIIKPDLADTQVFAKKSSNGLQVNLKLAQQRVGVFNFKVLELKTVDDFTENGGNEDCDSVQELFNFNFPITLPNKNIEKGQEFHTLNTQQRLYLSRDTFRLMEVINNQIAQIYERKRQEDRPGSTVSWQLVATINQFPTVLQGSNSANFLFSPNFDRYIDIVYSKQQFAIREVEWFQDGIPKIKDKEVLKKDLIPKDIISFKGYGEKDPKDIVKYIASRIAFVADNVIRVITLSGIDCLFDISDRKSQILPGVYNYRLLSFTKRDNYKMGTFNVENHSLVEKLPLHIDDVFVRLVRMNHMQKSWLDQYKHLIAETSNPVHKELKRVSRLTSVDYNLGTGGESNAFIAELSFTVLDWIILDKIQGSKQFTLRNIDSEQQLQLCFNIFPGGKTILHKLASEVAQDPEGGADEEGAYNTQQAVKDLFERAKSGVEFDCQYFDQGQALEIPIIQDMKNMTAIDVAMGLTEPSEMDKLLDEFGIEDDNDVLEMNMEMALILFECIKSYQMLHSSPYLIKAITEAIEHNLPGIGDYLDSRIVKYENIHISTMQRMIKNKKADDICGEQQYGVFSIDVIGKTKRVKNGLFKPDGPEKQMTFEIFDVPELYQDNKNGANFVRALGNSDNIELFSHIAVQKIVNFHWKDTSKFVYGTMFFPLCMQMMVFIQWHVAYIQEVDNPDFYYHLLVSKWLLVFFGCYFMFIELRQASRNWSNYFNVENMFDLIPNILVLFNCFFIDKINETEEVYNAETDTTETYETYRQTFWKIQAFAALTLWFKFILFLRVFDTTSFLIHMIIEVVLALIPFMLVLVLSIVAFTDAFYSLNMSYQDEDKIEGMENIRNTLFYAILNTFGEFGTDGLDLTGKLFFILASFVNLIILLNLVIAIISEVFTTVNTERLEAFYMERAQLIADVWTIFPPFTPDPQAKSRLLFFATEVSVKHIRKQVQDKKLQEEEDQKSEQIAMIQAIKKASEVIKTKLDEMKGLTTQVNQESALVRQETLGFAGYMGRAKSLKIKPRGRTFSDLRKPDSQKMESSRGDLLELTTKVDGLITRVDNMENQISTVDDKLDQEFNSVSKKLRSIVKKVNQILNSEDQEQNRTQNLPTDRNKSPL